MSDGFDFQTWLAGVQRQAPTQIGRFEIVQTLGKLNFVKCLDGLELHKQRVLHHQVRCILTDDGAIIPDDNTMLLRHGKTALAKLVGERVPLPSRRIPIRAYSQQSSRTR